VGLWLNHSVTPEMRKKAGQSLRKLGLGYLAERKMNKISSGEARRLLIARALVHDPRTLVFDEPTNSLDLKAQRDLRLKLRILARSGVGIVLATHQLSDIIPEIKRVILLKEGRIAADGPKEKIL
jgi:iron complex transport system ATP-binding protein